MERIRTIGVRCIRLTRTIPNPGRIDRRTSDWRLQPEFKEGLVCLVRTEERSRDAGGLTLPSYQVDVITRWQDRVANLHELTWPLDKAMQQRVIEFDESGGGSGYSLRAKAILENSEPAELTIARWAQANGYGEHVLLSMLELLASKLGLNVSNFDSLYAELEEKWKKEETC